MPSLSPRSRSKQRRQLESSIRKKRYTPNLVELRAVVDQYIDEKSRLDGYTSPSPSLSIEIGDVQQYIMEHQPTWSVPEKRRLQKFLNRAVVAKTKQQQSPSETPSETPSTTPSTPTSEQQQQGSNIGESTHSGLDNVSERSLSRSQRLRGITNRLFGSKKNLREIASPSKQLPILYIPTTDATSTIGTTADMLLNGEVLQPSYDEIVEVQAELSPMNDNEMDDVKDDTAFSTTVNDKNINVETSATTNNRGIVEQDESLLYNDDNDGTITKEDRCCFCWFM